MRNPLQTHQRRIMRILTMICFFHFSGLNNGFTFFAISPGQIRALNFAPVAIHSIASAINPFFWKRFLTRGAVFNSIFSSHRVLEISSRRVLRGMSSQWILLKARSGFRILGSGSTNISFSSPLMGEDQGGGDSLQAPAPSPRSLALSSDFSKESWLKRLDFIDWGRNLKFFLDPMDGHWTKIGDDGVDNRLMAVALFPLRAVCPGFRQRIHYSSDDGDAQNRCLTPVGGLAPRADHDQSSRSIQDDFFIFKSEIKGER